MPQYSKVNSQFFPVVAVDKGEGWLGAQRLPTLRMRGVREDRNAHVVGDVLLLVCSTAVWAHQSGSIAEPGVLGVWLGEVL